MMVVKDVFSIRLFFLLLACGFCIHIILGLYAMLNRDEKKLFRLKPYYKAMRAGLQRDSVHSNFVDVHPHFIARRGILESRNKEGASSTSSAYVSISGEEVELAIQCNTCTIVGITGAITEWGLGETIDRSDCVFRLGFSPTNGYENDVGRKTTMRIVDAKSLNPLLLRPGLRFMANRLDAENLLIFNTRAIDNPVEWHWKLKKFVEATTNNHTIYKLSKVGEYRNLRKMQKEGAKLGYSMLEFEPSAFWHAIQVASDTGCSDFQIVGVPDPKYCKRNMNSYITARYWDRYSPALCRGGGDVGLGQAAAVSNSVLPSLSDRRAVLAWSEEHNVTFNAPPWPNIPRRELSSTI